MGTSWAFEDVEHIFREHARNRGAEYNPSKPLAALDKGAIGRAVRLLGSKAWADFAAVAGVQVSTVKQWGNNVRRVTVQASIFPALCDLAARPYREHREAYERSAWLTSYIEEAVAHALTSGTEAPEDAAALLNDAWDRHNVAALLLAAFALPPNKLDILAGVAKGMLAAPPVSASIKTDRPCPSSDPARDANEAARITEEAETMEREAVNRIPTSTIGVDFYQLTALFEERAHPQHNQPE